MHRKLGPLETWQWLAIGLAAGVLYYLYERRQAAATSAANVGSSGANPTSGSTDLGPIDPTTGQPYALEGAAAQGANGSANQNGGPTSLAQELSDLTSIEGILAGLQQVTGGAVPAPGNGSTSTTNALKMTLGQETSAVKALTKAEQAQAKLVKNLTKQVNALKEAAADRGKSHNPGHITTTHPGGKTSVSSSAPHSGNNHSNVAPPTHQRHPPTSHPSKPIHGPAIGALPHWRA